MVKGIRMGIKQGAALMDLPAWLTRWGREGHLSKRKAKGLSFSLVKKGRDKARRVLVTQAPAGIGAAPSNWILRMPGTRSCLTWLREGKHVSVGRLSYVSSAWVGWVSSGSGQPREIDFVPFLLMEPVGQVLPHF